MGSGPVVVAVLSHRDPPQIRRLVDRILEGDDTVVMLHHDPRRKECDFPFGDRLLVAEAEPCDWGRMSLAMGAIRCLAAAIEQVPELSWVLLVSGQDYPTRHLRTIEADLAATSADAMLRHFRVDPEPGPGEDPWQIRCRKRYLHRIRIPGSRRSVPFPRRRMFGDGTGTDLYIGNMWVNLNGRAARHVLDQQQRRPDLSSYFSRCSIPDEAYVPTLLLNNATDLTVSTERRRFISWKPGEAHPRTLDITDLEAIRASPGDFFARKVDRKKSAALMDQLDADSR